MRKYIVLPSAPKDKKLTKLQVNHSIWGTPLRYSNDAILAAYQPGVYACVYDTYEVANAMRTCSRFEEPIFEVELINSALFDEDENSSSLDTYSYKLTSTHNITQVISAKHAGITYDLLTTWEQRKQLRVESNKLYDKYNTIADRTELKAQIGHLLKLVKSLKGKFPYAELTEIIKKTNKFLDKSFFETDNAGKLIAFTALQDYRAITEYRELAKTKQGAPSIAMQAIGICMLALAAAVVAMGFGVVPSTVIAIAGFGFFIAGRRETGVCKAMNDLSMGRSPG